MSSQRLKPVLSTFLLADQRLILWGRLKTPLDSRLSSKPNVLLTLRMILAAPLQSALIYHCPYPTRYKPRLVLRPDGFQSWGFSPIVGR